MYQSIIDNPKALALSTVNIKAMHCCFENLLMCRYIQKDSWTFVIFKKQSSIHAPHL